jgi:RND family efflux transporter MFP subunit
MINKVKKYISEIPRSTKATIILLTGTVLFIFYLSATKPAPPATIIKEKVWPVSAQQAEYKDIQPQLKLFGEIIASRRSELRAFVGGQVTQVGDNFKEGGVVKQGELLLTIDDFEYKNEVVEEKARYRIFKRDYERAEELFTQGSISEQFRDNALLEKTQQEIVLAEAEKDLRDTKLYAPYDGVINDVLASLGKQVSTFNDKIGEIIDINNLEVRFSLSKAQYGRLLEDETAIIGRPVSINWTAGNKTIPFEATIARIGAEIKSNTGGVDVFATLSLIDSGTALIRPGAFVRLTVPDKSYYSVIVVPETSIYEDAYVFVVNDQRLTKQFINILGYDGTNVLLAVQKSSDIQTGDMIITNQLMEAGEGVLVDIL